MHNGHVENLHFCWKIAIPDTIVYRESYVIMLWTFCIDQFREYPHKKNQFHLHLHVQINEHQIMLEG